MSYKGMSWVISVRDISSHFFPFLQFHHQRLELHMWWPFIYPHMCIGNLFTWTLLGRIGNIIFHFFLKWGKFVNAHSYVNILPKNLLITQLYTDQLITPSRYYMTTLYSTVTEHHRQNSKCIQGFVSVTSLIFVRFCPWMGFEKKFSVSIWKVWSLLLNQDCVDTEIQKIELPDILWRFLYLLRRLTRENVKQIIHDFVHLSNNLEDLLENPLQILSGFNLRGRGVPLKSSWVQNVLILTCVQQGPTCHSKIF